MMYNYSECTYNGDIYECIFVPWDEVTELLGHEHMGTSSDDDAIIDELLANGAPDWIKANEGGTDTKGWYVINWTERLGG